MCCVPCMLACCVLSVLLYSIWLRRVTVILRATCVLCDQHTRTFPTRAAFCGRPAGARASLRTEARVTTKRFSASAHPKSYFSYTFHTCRLWWPGSWVAFTWRKLPVGYPWDAKNFLVRAQRFAPAGARASVHGRRGAPKLASRTKSLHFVKNFNSPDLPHSSNIGKEHCSR